MKFLKQEQKKYEQIVDKLKTKNIRMTDIRLAIIAMLIKAEHLTTQEIIKNLELEFANVNVTSVYNTLDLLLSQHILFANTFNGKSIWYEIASEKSIHLKCDECGDVIHINPMTSDKFDFNEVVELAESKGIKLDHFKIEAHGICQNCRNK
ncbi:transcriptional repressor [Mesoplasma syrphidae]|uniref:Transcriptional repressor n=1 Tax=Mesoplasma syrphidae TaxID=225999 RepID=A0A2K9C4Z9_9MOLU|nr:Fur family transcriptional regulator [Mesoplasma syrphidae]AUF83357.1 transcriptional repressor [Mesoplasma syrphidae]